MRGHFYIRACWQWEWQGRRFDDEFLYSIRYDAQTRVVKVDEELRPQEYAEFFPIQLKGTLHVPAGSKGGLMLSLNG